MAVHVARIGIVPISQIGTVVDKRTATTGEMMTASSEQRVLVDDAIPNTAGNPTIKTYIEAEDVGGYKLAHLDQTYVITQT
jgi:hypothetical protein